MKNTPPILARALSLCVLPVLLLACTAGRAVAWDNLGHKTVATIAWDQLTPRAQAKITALFQADPRGRQFVNAAVWPDDIKKFLRNAAPKAPVNRPWHYVNIPYDGTAAQIAAAIEKPGVTADPPHAASANVVTGTRFYTALLKGGQGDARQQADALSFLIHYVGDLHQPLHCVAVLHPLPNYTPPFAADGSSADAGGNGFTLTGTPADLHAYWDDIFDLGQPDGSDTDANARTLATALQARIRPGMFALMKTDPKSWATESYAYRKFVYSPPIGVNSNPHGTIQHHDITPAYATKARGIAERQVVKAGYRLANLLNGIYDVP